MRGRCSRAVFATELCRLIHECIRELGPRVEFHVLVVILGLSGPLLPSRHGFRFAAGSPPFDPFGELDAMDILEVEFHLQDGWKSLDTFRVSDVGIERQWGFSPFEIQF